MKITDRIKSFVKGLLYGPQSRWMYSISSFGRPLRIKNVEQDPYGALAGWVYYAFDRIATQVASISLHLYQLKNDKVEEVRDHEILSLLYRANPIMTKSDMFYLLSMYRSIWGASPVWINKAGNKVIDLWPMRPDLLRMEQDDTGAIVKYQYTVGAVSRDFTPEEIIYIRKPDPQNPLKGFSRLQAAALEIDADFSMALWSKYLIQNGAEPGGVLETENELTDEQFERLRKQWEARYGGATNAGKVAILEAGLKFKPTAQTQKELDYNLSRQFNRDTILTLLGVPTSLIDAQANRANAETAERSFAKDTIKPEMQLIVDQFNEFFVPRFSETLFLDFDSPVSEDREQKRLDSQAATNAWQTVNETRASYGLPPLEGGDVMYLPLSMMPTVGPEQQAQKQQAGVVKMEKKTDVVIDPVVERNVRQAVQARTFLKRQIAGRVSEKVAERIAKIKSSIIKVKIKTKGTDEVGENLKNDRIAYLKKLPARQEQLSRIMQKYFSDQEAIVQKNLKETGVPKGEMGEKGFADWIKNILFDAATQISLLARTMHDVYKGNIQEGADDIAKLLGSNPTDVSGDPEAIKYLKDKPMKFADDVNQTTISQLRDALAAGVEESESLGQLGDRVANVFDVARGFRTETITRTEVGSAMNFGRFVEMGDQGVERKMWMAIFQNTREAHAEAHGQIVGVDEPFSVGGESLMFPQDPAGSADNVINCQCSVVPTLD